jgi:hypothetical protein
MVLQYDAICCNMLQHVVLVLVASLLFFCALVASPRKVPDLGPAPLGSMGGRQSLP